MLRNCIYPVNYLKSNTQTCGDIVCENLQEFVINCKLCKMKLFQFEEFVQHFKNVHLEQENKKVNLKQEWETNLNQEQDNEEILDNIKIENTTLEEQNYTIISNKDNINNEWLTNDECDYEAKSEEDEADYRKTILPKPHKPKEFACDICPKKCADQRRLQLHKTLAHLREKPFKCSLCEMSFPKELYLQKHTRSKHTDYECLICHKVFTTNTILKRHILIHADKKDFICNEEKCGKAFATKVLLKIHQRCHMGDIFVCEECGFKCKKQEYLIVHKRNHTGEKPFACELCTSRFGSKKLLKEHMACHETERKHICEVCGKSFNRPKALYHHKHLHLGIKKFVCKICGQAYAQAAGLSAHMRKHRENVNSCSADTNSLNLFNTV